MNEIIITGSTGVIGRRAVREVLAAGYHVTGVARSQRGHERLERLGARAVEADVFDEASLRRAFAGADAVINLLTHIPAPAQMADPAAWEENDRIRSEASAAIARAAQAAGVQRLVQESIAIVYADGGTRLLDEDSPVAGGGVATAPLTAERNARELFDGDTVVLRFGVFIGPGSESTLAALQAARDGASIAPGPPGAYRPTVWLDDAAAAIALALRAPAGTYNVVDTIPATNAEIDAALAAAVGVKSLRSRRPHADSPVARSQRVSNERLREATGLVAGRPRGHRRMGASRRMTRENRYWWQGSMMEIKARGEDTRGALGVLEGRFYGHGYGPPLHVHSNEDEVIYVLAGHIRFRVGDDDFVASPGDWVWQPRGVPQSFRLKSDSAHVLVIFTPAGMERMFEQGDVAAGESTEPPSQEEYDLDLVLALQKRFGFEVVGPQVGPPSR